VSLPTGRIVPVRIGDATAIRFTVSSTEEVGFPHIHQDFSARTGEILEATALVRTASSVGGKGAYLSFSFFGTEPNRIGFTQSESTHDLEEWTEIRLASIVPEEATRARLSLIFHGWGSADFGSSGLRRDSGRWREVEGNRGVLEFETKASIPLVGFGAEDDGWFYNSENLGTGFTDEDIDLRENRVRDLDPDWVRMFVWHKDWNPSGDWTTYDFESENMRSHYRTLDLYQEIGATVNVVGVEWGVENPYDNIEATARGIGALFEHLVRERGYSRVKEWTLSNEPNHSFPRFGYTFEDYKRIHLAVKDEFRKRNLEVSIVGSDDAQDLVWFSKCVEDEVYRNLVDRLASHRYFKGLDRYLAREFFETRKELARKHLLDLPLTLAEFGFQDDRSSTFDNPLMRTYDYALWTASLVIEGLNSGFSGFNIWTLHEMTYPGGSRMVYGLWDYKENGWKLRPVYYAMRNFCRLTEPGDPIFRAEIEPFVRVNAARVGNAVFWVNENEEEKKLAVMNAKIGAGRSWTEETIGAEDLEGEEMDVRGNAISLPPRSFGFLMVE